MVAFMLLFGAVSAHLFHVEHIKGGMQMISQTIKIQLALTAKDADQDGRTAMLLESPDGKSFSQEHALIFLIEMGWEFFFFSS